MRVSECTGATVRWLLAGAVVLVGCRQPSEVVDLPPPEIARDFSRLPEILAGLQNATDVSLHEGLPDVFWEPQLREEELRRWKTIKVQGYPFYDEPCPLQPADAARLTALFSQANSYRAYGAAENCGGYHPDYCIGWQGTGGPVRALVSLECGEIKLYGPQVELHCDLDPACAERLKPLLEPYRKNRPRGDST